MLNAAVTAAADGGDLVPIYYLAGIIAAILSGLWALRAYMASQRARWVAEGRKEANLADKLESNTQAAQGNTKAIENLTRELRDFVTNANDRLNRLDNRVGMLERRGGKDS